MELGVGMGYVEQGDDRQEPTAVLHAGVNEDWAGDFYYYGRTFGPVKAETYLLAAYRRWSIFSLNFLTAHAGVSLIDEHIILQYSEAGAQASNQDEHNYNVGANFGVAVALPPKLLGPFWAELAWDSHVFPAGLEGAIFLTSGRKQTITFNMGVALR